MNRAVIARIHHHKFIRKAMGHAKFLAPCGIKLHISILRPGWDHGDFSGRNALGNNPIAHEAIQGKNGFRTL